MSLIHNINNLESYLGSQNFSESIHVYFDSDLSSFLTNEPAAKEESHIKAMINRSQSGLYTIHFESTINDELKAKIYAVASFLLPQSPESEGADFQALKKRRVDNQGKSIAQFLQKVSSIFSQKEPINESEIASLYNDSCFESCDQSEINIKMLGQLKSVFECKNAGGDWKKESEDSHTNAVYFLKNSKDEVLFVFKPNPKKSNREGIPIEEKSKREHLAHLLNFHGQFPIPFTAYVKIDNEIGSIQRYIEGKRIFSLCEGSNSSSSDSDKIPSDSSSSSTDMMSNVFDEINQQELFALLVFDLLFFNTDRHIDNCIFQRIDRNYPTIKNSNKLLDCLCKQEVQYVFRNE